MKDQNQSQKLQKKRSSRTRREIRKFFKYLLSEHGLVSSKRVYTLIILIPFTIGMFIGVFSPVQAKYELAMRLGFFFVAIGLGFIGVEQYVAIMKSLRPPVNPNNPFFVGDNEDYEDDSIEVIPKPHQT